jgi:hypothetical protein
MKFMRERERERERAKFTWKEYKSDKYIVEKL